MTATVAPAGPVYDALADAYDTLMGGVDYESWVVRLLDVARDAGLVDGPVLDVGCGAGAACRPLVDAGWRVTGVDVSAEMLAMARARVPEASFLRADMRDLPVLDAFALVLCINDSLNHLAGTADLRAALAGMAANLTPGGLLVLDLNTLATMRTAFSTQRVAEGPGRLVLWRGLGSAEMPSGGSTAARVDVLHEDGGSWRRRTVELRERHFPSEVVVRLLGLAGLEAVMTLGQQRGARLHARADELSDHKTLVVARRPGPATTGGR